MITAIITNESGNLEVTRYYDPADSELDAVTIGDINFYAKAGFTIVDTNGKVFAVKVDGGQPEVVRLAVYPTD